MHYKAIVFDVADTLIEFVPNWATIYAERVQRLGFRVNNELAQIMSQRVNQAICQQYMNEYNGMRKATKREKNEKKDVAALSCVVDNVEICVSLAQTLADIPLPPQQKRVKENVYDVLNTLKKRGYKLGIVSNFDCELYSYLFEVGLCQFFDSVIISEIVGVQKPDVHIMELALAELSVEPTNSVYVGDQPLDVLCAKRAGMDCIWLAPDNIIIPSSMNVHEDYRIHSIEQLLYIL